jgi:regulatory protein YycH of two-component signal transduction system YycFG
MKKYLFKTTTTMKEYNAKKWWIDRDYIPQTTIEAENLKDALTKYREFTEKHCVSISDNALKTKAAMYIDTTEGVKQCGYVITGKTDFDNDHKGWTTQYIDLWVNISEILDIDFDC